MIDSHNFLDSCAPDVMKVVGAYKFNFRIQLLFQDDSDKFRISP